MTNNKQTVLSAEELTQAVFADQALRYHFALNGGAGPVSKKGVKIFRAVESAVLSKLRAAGEPSDEEILQTFSEACEYADRCGQGFSYGRAQALRAVISRYAAPQASAEARPLSQYGYQVLFDAISAATWTTADGDIEISVQAFRDALKSAPAAEEPAIDKPIPDSVEHYGLIDERVGAPAASAEPREVDMDEYRAMVAAMEQIDPATFPGLTASQRCALGRFAKPAGSAQKADGGDVVLPPLPSCAIQTAGWDGTGVAEYYTADQMRAYVLADRQQRGGDVGEPPPITARYGTQEFDHQTAFAEGWQAARAALAAQPAAEDFAKAARGVDECSFSDLIDAYTDAVRNGNFSERVAARAELMNSYRQQRGGDAIDVEAAAQKLAECMDCPWTEMPEQGRKHMREHAQAVVRAALATHKSDGGDAKDAERWRQAKANWLITHVRLNASTSMRNPDGIPWTTLEQQIDVAIAQQRKSSEEQK